MKDLPKVARQKTGNLDELYSQAYNLFPDFSSRMEDILKNLQERAPEDFSDMRIVIAKIKDPQKARDNVLDKFNGDACLTCDLLRASCIGEAKTFVAITEEIGNQFEIVARKNRIARPNKYGYRDDKINGALPNGHVCEVQCKVKEIDEVSDLTHEARDRANAIEAKADKENRDMNEQERTEYDFLKKLCLGIHNKAAIAGGLNEYLSPELSENRRLELSIVGFPVVDFKHAAQPHDKSPKPEVSIQLAEGLSFTFTSEETFEA